MVHGDELSLDLHGVSIPAPRSGRRNLDAVKLGEFGIGRRAHANFNTAVSDAASDAADPLLNHPGLAVVRRRESHVDSEPAFVELMRIDQVDCHIEASGMVRQTARMDYGEQFLPSVFFGCDERGSA